MSPLTTEILKNGVLKHIEPQNGPLPKDTELSDDAKSQPEKDDLTTTQKLMQIILSIHFFCDTSGTAWAKMDGKCHPVNSIQFKRRLQRRYYQLYNKTPYNQAVQDVLDQATGIALFESNEEEVYIRVARTAENIIIDRNDGTVIITPNKWEDVAFNNANFWRPQGLNSLPEPKRGGNSLALLRNYLNFETDSDFQLLVAWLLTAYNPDIACPILTLQGEQGSAKSTNAKVLRSLIDPNGAMITPAPRNERDLVIQAQNSRVLCLDNLSGLKKWLSDALCRICTGTGFTTRRFYTNDEQEIFKIMRPIILNGIDDIATRGDLLDRSIVLNLPAIPAHKRRDERNFWSAFKQDQPTILAALYDVIAAGLAEPKPQFSELPRMADFAEWITRCEIALNWDNGSMIQAYNGNKDNAIETGLDGDYLASALIKILDGKSHYEGTATNLVEKVKGVAPEVNEKYLPTTKTLKNRLTRLAPALRKIGITWEYKRKGSDGSRTYILDNEPNKASEVSVVAKNGQDTDATDSSDTSNNMLSELPF